MAYWYVLNIGDGITSAESSDEIQQQFLGSLTETGNPPEMAVFTRLESEGRLHCEVMVYFSPAAARIAEKFDAQPCDKPERTGLGLLAGDARSWSVLFPENPE